MSWHSSESDSVGGILLSAHHCGLWLSWWSCPPCRVWLCNRCNAHRRFILTWCCIESKITRQKTVKKIFSQKCLTLRYRAHREVRLRGVENLATYSYNNNINLCSAFVQIFVTGKIDRFQWVKPYTVGEVVSALSQVIVTKIVYFVGKNCLGFYLSFCSEYVYIE